MQVAKDAFWWVLLGERLEDLVVLLPLGLGGLRRRFHSWFHSVRYVTNEN
jgi:hypothetical protein